MKIFAVIAVMVTATGQFVKNDGSLIGVMGILKEVAEGKQYIGIGYILNKNIGDKAMQEKELRLCVNMLFVNCSCKRLRRRSDE